MPPTDDTGQEVLEVIAAAGRFNHWMYQSICKYLSGNILEIGSGTGNISVFFLRNNANITLSDVSEMYTHALTNKFREYPNLVAVLNIDLEKEDFETVYAPHKEKYDSIFLLNVLEHIREDNQAIQHCSFLLKPGGQLVVLTPAYSFLYSRLDKALGHHRRYRLGQLKRIFATNGLSPVKGFYFNALGIVGWLYGKLFGLKTIPSTEMKFFNKLVPAAKILDKIIFRKAGLSVILAAKKTA